LDENFIKVCSYYFIIQALKNNLNIHDFYILTEFIEIVIFKFSYVKMCIIIYSLIL